MEAHVMEQFKRKWLVALITLAVLILFGLMLLVFRPELLKDIFNLKDLIYGSFIVLLVLPAAWRRPLRNSRLQMAVTVALSCVLLAGVAVFVLG